MGTYTEAEIRPIAMIPPDSPGSTRTRRQAIPVGAGSARALGSILAAAGGESVSGGGRLPPPLPLQQPHFAATISFHILPDGNGSGGQPIVHNGCFLTGEWVEFIPRLRDQQLKQWTAPKQPVRLDKCGGKQHRVPKRAGLCDCVGTELGILPQQRPDDDPGVRPRPDKQPQPYV